MWVGTRESLAEMTALTGISCAPISELDAALGKNIGATTVRLLAEADEVITRRVGELRAEAGVDLATATEGDAAFLVTLSEARLVKDDFELDQLRQACNDTAVGFEAVVADLPEAVRRGRGERWVEGVFGLHARHQANAIGYDTIAASGDHANTLHWIRNDGDVRPGDLLLMDAGVEVESLYTADITRTLPVSGTFSPAQRKVYEAVLAAQEAGIAAAKPGNKFSDVHKAAVAVIAEHLEAWGLLPVTAAESLDPERGGHHRRWMVHGTSHHLGLDVHDCAQARQENYRDARTASRHGDHGRARPLLQGDRPAGARGTARHRRPDRGRHRDHRGRQRDPLLSPAAGPRRRRGLDGRHLGPLGRHRASRLVRGGGRGSFSTRLRSTRPVRVSAANAGSSPGWVVRCAEGL